jgi:hypothetical protein
VTIFGPTWEALRPVDVQAFLDQADDEPLLWEAKGTDLKAKEVRRQVAAFANGHEVGYLILGADKAVGENPEHKWMLDGVPFPDEPTLWISNVVADRENGVRPRPDFDVRPWPAPNGHVAVVRITPTSTPPCIANGTVYERLPGKTQTVQDPLKLADLFSRGDQARRDAEARADRAALTVMRDWLEGEAGEFRTEWLTAQLQPTEEDETAHVRFAVGVAATGNPPNIAGRLFREEFVEEVWTQLRDRPLGLPAGFGRPPEPAAWSQEALTWRHQVTGHLDFITIVRASWDGSVAAGEKLAAEDVYPDSLASHRAASSWRIADELVSRLGGFGDVYVTVVLAGGRFPRRRDSGYIVMRRGPLPPGVETNHVASLSREFMRAVGDHAPEP